MLICKAYAHKPMHVYKNTHLQIPIDTEHCRITNTSAQRQTHVHKQKNHILAFLQTIPHCPTHTLITAPMHFLTTHTDPAAVWKQTHPKHIFWPHNTHIYRQTKRMSICSLYLSPSSSWSPLYQRSLAGGLLPVLVQVRVTLPPSCTAFSNPEIWGLPGTPGETKKYIKSLQANFYAAGLTL